MITIDGLMGEGGGQVLRTSLGLSLVTGKPFRIEKIRAGGEKPGLMRQHLTAVRAAAQIGDAKVSGDEIGSRTLVFEPCPVRPGEYEFAVGTAGSATLVLQTVLPALIVASGPSRLTLKGGTHNPWSPPFDFLKKAFLPLLAKMGAAVTVELVRPGSTPPAAESSPLRFNRRLAAGSGRWSCLNEASRSRGTPRPSSPGCPTTSPSAN